MSGGGGDGGSSFPSNPLAEADDQYDISSELVAAPTRSPRLTQN
jgi:hypothetical protein